MFFFLLSLVPLYGQCPLKTNSKKSISTIQTSDIPGLVQQGAGCLTLVELWAGWCGTCRTTKPEIIAIHKDNPHIARLSISADYTEGALKNYLQKNKYVINGHHRLEKWTLETLTKSFSRVHAHFEGAIPLILLYDEQGTLLYEATEPSDLSGLKEIIAEQNFNTKPKKTSH
jgi:thiol-disulfide isomerase/thioredoxin